MDLYDYAIIMLNACCPYFLYNKIPVPFLLLLHIIYPSILVAYDMLQFVCRDVPVSRMQLMPLSGVQIYDSNLVKAHFV